MNDGLSPCESRLLKLCNGTNVASVYIVYKCMK